MLEIASGTYVLDTHAMLALLQKEVGEELVSALLASVNRGDVTLHLSLINLGEIAYTSERKKGAKHAAEAVKRVRQLPIIFEEVTEARILAAAHIKAQHAVSYADSFAIALAQELKAVLVTGDPEIHQTGLVTILWV